MKVIGGSLSPFLRHGDFVLLVRTAWWPRRLRPGDVIVFLHPVYGRMIKRIQSISPDGCELFVIGDAPDSIDSRQFGPISRSAVFGKVLFLFRQQSQ
jgi:nickel-type superoxide dismutase maturation protease